MKTDTVSEIILGDEGIIVTLRPGCAFAPEAYRFVQLGQSGSGWIELFGEGKIQKVVIPEDMFGVIAPELEAGAEISLIEFDGSSSIPFRELILECEN